MCSNDSKFVVPTKPAALAGWWIGKIITKNDKFREINVLWVENPRYLISSIIASTIEYVREFDTYEDAVNSLPPGVFYSS